MNLSKSKYITGKRCSKCLWLSCYKPEEKEEQPRDVILESGNKVGELARHLFGDDYILIQYDNNIQNMIDETNKYLDKKPNIICEASFEYDGNFCSVDILKNNIDGVEIYEVKSSTEIRDIYIDDLSYQTWVLKQCGLNVKKSCLVFVNNEYVKEGKLDLNKYFIIQDLTSDIDNNIATGVENLKRVINSDKEPNVDISMSCKKNNRIPYDCPFFKYCTRELPKPNLFDVGWRSRFDKKLDLYYREIVSFDDVLSAGGLNSKADVQMNYELHNLEPKINKDKIKELIESFTYPLYFLDFESYQVAIPEIDGTKPYQQICFQYSLHYYLEDDGKLYHKEFLSEDYNGNPMYGMCKQLCEDIPMNSCVIVYNDTFEKTRLKEMAEMFPEFREHLLNIRDNIIDIMIPFSNQDYYVKEMGGRWSIKVVLPALFPNEPSLDYHNLEQVHKGDEASNAYLSLANLSREEQDELRKNMLKYCELDTYAMVKIYEKLRNII